MTLNANRRFPACTLISMTLFGTANSSSLYGVGLGNSVHVLSTRDLSSKDNISTFTGVRNVGLSSNDDWLVRRIPRRLFRTHLSAIFEREFTGRYLHRDGINEFCFASGCNILASASDDGTIGITDLTQVSNGSCRELNSDYITLDSGGGFLSVCWSPSEEYVAGGTRSGIVLVLKLANRAIRLLEGHTAAITSVAFDDSGQLLFSAARDGTVNIWDTSSGALVSKLDSDHESNSPIKFHARRHLIAYVNESRLGGKHRPISAQEADVSGQVPYRNTIL